MTLRPLPPKFVQTRRALHQIAFFALGPARHTAVGRMGLRATPGGCGTPEFEGRVARVEGDLLVHEEGGNVATQTITTVRKAARFFGREYDPDWFSDFHDPPEPVDPDEPLDVDREASLAVGEWFRFALEVLERLRSQAQPGDDPSEIQLWPEHFDYAAELGDQDKGQRASYGASPGDDDHDEPYFYVAAWSEIDRSNPYWNDTSFNGSSLSYSELQAGEDPAQAALDFLVRGYRILHAD